MKHTTLNGLGVSRLGVGAMGTSAAYTGAALDSLRFSTRMDSVVLALPTPGRLA